MKAPTKPKTDNPRSHRTYFLAQELHLLGDKMRKASYIPQASDLMSAIDYYYQLSLYEKFEREYGDAEDIFNLYTEWLGQFSNHWWAIDQVVCPELVRQAGLDAIANPNADEAYNMLYCMCLLELASIVDYFEERGNSCPRIRSIIDEGVMRISMHPQVFSCSGIPHKQDAVCRPDKYKKERLKVRSEIMRAVRWVEFPELRGEEE